MLSPDLFALDCALMAWRLRCSRRYGFSRAAYHQALVRHDRIVMQAVAS